MSRSLQVILVMSLVFNFVLVGYLAGSHIHHHSAPFHERWKDQKWRHDFRQAPQHVHQRLQMLRQETQPMMKKMHQLRQQSMKTLRAKEFDAALFKQQMTEMNAMKIQLQTQFSQSIEKIASELEEEERQALGQWLSQHPGFGTPRPPGPRRNRE